MNRLHLTVARDTVDENCKDIRGTGRHVKNPVLSGTTTRVLHRRQGRVNANERWLSFIFFEPSFRFVLPLFRSVFVDFFIMSTIVF